jgi:DNA-directed RNA polymerase specialized sigma24 family protein
MEPPRKNVLTRKLVQEALDGNHPGALRLVVAERTPHVQSVVAHALSKRRRYARSDQENLMQELLIRLLYGVDAKYLNAWDPARGYGYVVTRLRWSVASLLRVDHGASATVSLEPEALAKLPGAEDSSEDRARAVLEDLVLVELKIELSPHERVVLDLLLEGLSAREVCERTGMPTENAVYSLRQRIVQKAQKIARRILP